MAARKLSGAALADALYPITGHRFSDHDRLRRALTHASARSSTGIDYERMEFLGDRVLGLIVAEHVYRAFPDAPEGELSLRLNGLVNAEVLARIAEDIGLSELVHAGSEIRNLEGRKRMNIHADAMESLIAALYLEGGLDAVRPFILRHWAGRLDAPNAVRRDPKTALQEWAHVAAAAVPAYSLDSREGPDHDPLFTVTVRVATFEPGVGTGRSKRQAEQAAATVVLVREGVWTVAASA